MDTDGCIVCTDSKLAFCVTESNYVNSQHIIYCNSFPTFISRSYTNTITQPDPKTTGSSSKSSRSSISSGGSTATNTGTSTGGTATVTATATATPSPASKSTLSTGALIGIGIGGFAVISTLAALLFWFCWRSRKGKYINPNVAGGRSSLPVSPYAPIALESTSKYQPDYANSRAEMASPPLAGNAAFRQYDYPGSGRQSPAPGPEAYLLPVHQQYQYQPYNPVSTPPTAAYSQPQTPATHHLPPTSPATSNDNRVSALSELGDTMSYRMSSTPGPSESTMTLSATGAGGYVSPEDALRTGRVPE
ncbi:MAG: hypothetical protein M1813_001710 [Trichoglossum hirsutum]|nr:MAG: hypothetical protein M1813_001710 [Trichoglossum hirsutum]